MIIATTFAQDKLSGGGDLNPDLKAPYEAQQKWLDLKIGLSVHWRPSSLGGKEISWSRGNLIPREVYDSFYKDFNPDKFDADEWCRLMKRWGIRYISPTAKHHDGFALWFSDYSEYDMEIAKRKIDIMEELRKACKKHDIMFGAYYSNLDWFHPDWTPYQYGGPGDFFPKYADSPNLDRYFKYMEDQVVELIEKYDVEFLQFDGEWDSTYTHEVGSKLYRKFHEVNPDILLSSRIDIGRRSEGANNHLHIDGKKYAGDFLDRERLVNHGNNVTEWFDDAWQAWVTIDKTQWSHNPTPTLMSASDMIDDMLGVIGSNGNYMINLAPKPNGAFSGEQIALMDTLGMWIAKHDNAIYGTRGGPYYPFNGGVSTRKGNKAWIFMLDRDVMELSLPILDQDIKSVKVFGTNRSIACEIIQNTTRFSLPKSNGEVRVLELTFRDDIAMSKHRVIETVFEQNAAKRLIDGITFKVSSDSEWAPSKKEQDQLLRGVGRVQSEYAFHTKEEINPFVIMYLGEMQSVMGLIIHNRPGSFSSRAKNLNVWISDDGKEWIHKWKCPKVKNSWDIPFTYSKMGAEVMGVNTRYIKIGLDSSEPNYLHLPRIEVYVE